MELTNETRLSIQFEGTEIHETTWGVFATDNDDEELIAEVAERLETDRNAVIGGGAAPLVRISVH